MGALWIPISLLAACLQIARTGMQKSLKADLDDWSVTWVRSGFALPLAALYALAAEVSGFGASVSGAGFFMWCALSALAQVAATAMLVALFSRRNFAVSTAFSKTEAPQIALFGFLFFGEGVSGLGALGVVLGFCGVLLMMSGGGFAGGFARGNLRKFWRRESLTACGLGLGAGFFFALTALFILRAYDSLEGGAFGASALALLTVIAMQTAGLGLALLFFRRGAFARMWAVRGRCFSVGLTSVLGSACWFGAFALAHPAYVKTLSQVELPLAWLVGRRAFRERPGGLEFAGMALVGAGAIAAAFAG